MLEQLPLLHDGDAFFITLQVEAIVYITRIVRFRNNQNTSGEEMRFLDLDNLTRLAIMRQVRRRYENRTIQVTHKK